MLLDNWANQAHTPSNYPYPPRLALYLFMLLNTFMARKIHQMHARKNYLAAHYS